jgi:tripartite-type tricarboxylate transporter receptor subunit TctC
LGTKINMVAGLQVREIPYKAIGAELPDLMAGHVTAAYLAPVVVAQHIRSGRLVALGVAGAKRIPILPDVPTLSESGLRGTEIYEWNAVFAPANTPEPVMKKLAEAFQQALDSPEVKARIAQLGGDIQKGSPEQAKRHNVKPGITGWAQVNGRNAISWEQKFKYDVEYVEKQSLLLDIKILWMTFINVIQRKGISSDGHVTMEEFKG